MILTRGFPALALLLVFVLGGCATTNAPHYSVTPPKTAPRELVPIAEFASPEIDESSGIARSLLYPGVFWTHNDSGDTSRIFPVNLRGEDVGPSAGMGIQIPNAINRDWEDIASDHTGNLLIGAFGNNANKRRDLSVYLVPEPNPMSAEPVRSVRRVPFHFPEQTAFPPADNNYDVEALFAANGTWYVFTKHRTDAETRLYRFDSYDEEQSNPLKLLGSFASRGAVTAAASLPDGSRVAVLVYGSVWLFEPPHGDVDDLFSGKIYWRPIRAAQAEGICFINDDSLLITNEQGELFRVEVAELLEVR